MPDTLYFLRDTPNPQADLIRGFSCHIDGWKSSKEEAAAWQNENGAIAAPFQDPHSLKWCADPETGLSSYAFGDSDSFNQALEFIESFWTGDRALAVFSSNDYDLNAGADGEDVFRNGTFIGLLDTPTWDDFIDILSASK